MLSKVRRLHYITVLTAQIFLLFIAAVMEHHIILTVLFIVSLFGIFGSIISTVWGSSRTRYLSLIIAAIAIVSGLLGFFPVFTDYAIRTGLTVCCLSYATFILIAIVSIGRNVFVTDRVTANRIVGSICVYMLLGMFFAFIYASMALIHGSMFSMSEQSSPGKFMALRDFIYFSYSTLTTTGYGDILPTNPIARMVSCLESIAGSVYLAIMVARLVGMHVTQAHQHHEASE